MKVIGLDLREYKLDLIGKQVSLDATRPRSNGHKLCRKLLKELYPGSPLLEEVKLPGTNNLSFDFFIPNRMMAVEVNGPQHYKFVSHFHGTRAGFLKSQVNDRNKKEWCDLNNITLVDLPDTETVDSWRETLNNIYKNKTNVL